VRTSKNYLNDFSENACDIFVHYRFLARIEYLKYIQKGSLVQLTVEWLRQSGTPQSCLVLLDRADNSDNSRSEDTSDIPF
jgi:hypothetical protein